MGSDANTDLERRAAAIFERTVDAPTADRPAAMAAACGDDAPLLDRVRALLAADHSDAFLGAPTIDAGGMPTAVPLAERPGTVVGGRYKLLQQIGEGGFGVVFLAEQERPVRRQVALKVIKLGMDTREVVARFEAERQALAMMDHPNIAKVLDAGSTEAGRPYFVMELVRGLPITEYADKHRLPAADRVALLQQVCRAVQHAHGKGVIHRDLKPSNVLVGTGDGDQPVPKVIDFGIAKATQSKLTDRTLFTQFRQLIGTPQYMSPEQADSEGLDVDTRSDVYSLGVVLYELLVGVTPMDARALRSAAFEAMRRMIRDGDVPRPSTRLHTMAADTAGAVATNRSTDAAQLGRAVRGELDWIVMRALEKDRVRRYDTAAALADDLNRYLSGDAVLAGPVSGLYRLRKTLRRYKLAVGVGGAIAASLLLGVAGTTLGLIRATASERRAVASADEAKRQKSAADVSATEAAEKAAEAKATLDFFTGLLAKASPLEAKDAAVSQVLVDKLIAPAMATVDRRFADQPLVRASVQETLAETLDALARYDLAEPQARAAYDARRQRLRADHPDMLASLNLYARMINVQGRHVEAEAMLKRCWDARRRVLGEDHPDTLLTLCGYAQVIDCQGRHVEAEPFLRHVVDRYPSARPGDVNGGSVLYVLSQCLEAQHKWAEAETVLRENWAWDRAHPDPTRWRAPGSLQHLNDCLQHEGRPLEGGATTRPTTAATVVASSADAELLVVQAAPLVTTGHSAAALPPLRRAADYYRQSAPNDPGRGVALYYLGQALANRRQWPEAEDMARENWAWDQSHPSPGRTSGTVPGSLTLLNRCLKAQDKPTEPTTATRPTTDPAKRATDD